MTPAQQQTFPAEIRALTTLGTSLDEFRPIDQGKVARLVSDVLATGSVFDDLDADERDRVVGWVMQRGEASESKALAARTARASRGEPVADDDEPEPVAAAPEPLPEPE